jgi:predicted enzyme related to lactoylglutathione lyase
MSDFNSEKNRVVWIDIPVADLERAQKFYAAVLAIPVQLQEFGDFKFCVLDHQDGNGGCLVLNPDEISDKGVLIYLNVNDPLRDALAKVEPHGGAIITPAHNIGPHGYRAVIKDSEGNRVALHSMSDK